MSTSGESQLPQTSKWSVLGLEVKKPKTINDNPNPKVTMGKHKKNQSWKKWSLRVRTKVQRHQDGNKDLVIWKNEVWQHRDLYPQREGSNSSNVRKDIRYERRTRGIWATQVCVMPTLESWKSCKNEISSIIQETPVGKCGVVVVLGYPDVSRS